MASLKIKNGNEWIKIPNIVNYNLKEIFGIGQGITSGADLNDYIVPGKYQIGTNVNAATLLNCPVKWAFTMNVYNTNANANIAQEITPYTYADWMGDTRPATKYIRFHVENAWSPWLAVGGIDSIVAEGISGGWRYIKFANGDCFMSIKNTIKQNFSVATDGLYAAPEIAISYPFSLIDTYAATATFDHASARLSAVKLTVIGLEQIRYKGYHGESVEITPVINIFVHGRWK